MHNACINSILCDRFGADCCVVDRCRFDASLTTRVLCASHCIINANRTGACFTTFVYIPSSRTDSSAAHVNRLILTAEFEFNVDLVEFVIIEIFTFFSPFIVFSTLSLRYSDWIRTDSRAYRATLKFLRFSAVPIPVCLWRSTQTREWNRNVG